MARAFPYRVRAPPGVATTLAEIPYSRLFVIHESGPTSFVLRAEESARKYRVSVGEQHSCNCSGGGSELCEHVLFVLVRVFRMQIANPLVWQRGLTEREITELLRGRPSAQLTRPPPRASAVAAPVAEEGVPRKEMDDDELCPICYDTMSFEQDVTFCKRSCGKNVHTKCMKMWADNRISNGDAVTCPLCRSDWGVPDWINRPRGGHRRAANALAVHTGVTCSGCRAANFAGSRYKCMICNNYDLCDRCFADGSNHANHPFIGREGIDSTWAPADRLALADADPAAASGLDSPSGEAGEEPGGGGGVPPLVIELLTKLPVRTAGVNGEPGQCDLCSSGFRQMQLIRYLPCSCSFHQRCADRYLTEQHGCCPNDICGMPVTAEAVDRQLAAIASEARRQRAAANPNRPKRNVPRGGGSGSGAGGSGGGGGAQSAGSRGNAGRRPPAPAGSRQAVSESAERAAAATIERMERWGRTDAAAAAAGSGPNGLRGAATGGDALDQLLLEPAITSAAEAEAAGRRWQQQLEVERAVTTRETAAAARRARKAEAERTARAATAAVDAEAAAVAVVAEAGRREAVRAEQAASRVEREQKDMARREAEVRGKARLEAKKSEQLAKAEEGRAKKAERVRVMAERRAEQKTAEASRAAALEEAGTRTHAQW